MDQYLNIKPQKYIQIWIPHVLWVSEWMNEWQTHVVLFTNVTYTEACVFYIVIL